jgi:hypothetical protein
MWLVRCSGGGCERGPVHDLPSAGHQHAEYCGLARGKMDEVAVNDHPPPCHVEHHTVDFDQLVAGILRGLRTGVRRIRSRAGRGYSPVTR